LSKVNGWQFENFSVENGSPGRHINQLLEEKAGNLWAFTPKESIGYFDAVRWRVVCQAENCGNTCWATGSRHLKINWMKKGF